MPAFTGQLPRMPRPPHERSVTVPSPMRTSSASTAEYISPNDVATRSAWRRSSEECDVRQPVQRFLLASLEPSDSSGLTLWLRPAFGAMPMGMVLPIQDEESEPVLVFALQRAEGDAES